MPSGVLVIGETEQKMLTDAMARARERPTPLSEVMRTAAKIDQSSARVTFDEREAALQGRGEEPRRESVSLPVGYRVAISFEEQPAGMCLHISMSSSTPGKLPRPEAIAMVMSALGHPGWQISDGRVWIEDFAIDGKPGGKAVNVVVITEPAKGGHA